jgi:hypothetical protein
MQIFAQLAKIDESRREVWGIATAEVVDKEGEIFDYETSKPYFKSWSDEIAKATDGKSLGNVREMHAPSAVGKLVALEFDDEQKQVRVGARIVDDVAWQKCTLGVYTGFSIGGAYVKTWKEGEYTRFTANPVEISVVDNPCVPGAHFTAVKADGSSEVRKFNPAPAFKIGAKHSRETLAHLDAIKACLDQMADCHEQAASHLNALLDKDDNGAAMATAIPPRGIKKDSGAMRPKIKTGEQNSMLEAKEKDQLEKAHANSASALSKVAELEKGVAQLRSEMESNNQEILKSLTNVLTLVERLVNPNEPGTKVARTSVGGVTLRKEDDNHGAEKPEVQKSVHELLKQSLQNPQRASNYLR